MNDVANTFLLIYASLFPIVNPVGGAPIFLGLTRYLSDEERRSLAARVAINSFLLLFCSLFVGSHVLEFFGIALPVVSVAGGLVVSAFAWKLLHANIERVDHRGARSGDAPVAPTDSFYPLTMPLTVGPGSISVAITLGSQRPTEGMTYSQLVLLGGAAVMGLVAIAVTIYLSYRFAEKTAATIGESATNVVVRLTAFILLCIGIQIIWKGYSGLTQIAT